MRSQSTLERQRPEERRFAWPEALSPERLGEVTEPTPFLVVDPAAIERRYRELVAALPGFAVFYAAKCNASAVVLSTLASLGASFEVASVHELEAVAAQGVAPADVLYSNTVKPASYVARAFSLGLSRFAFDSEAELRKLAATAPGCAVYARLTVEDGHSLFPLSRKFGTTVEEACRLLVLARELGLRPYGVTFHVGSQCTEPVAWERALLRCGALLDRLAAHGIRLEMLDVGGGLPAAYAEPVPSLDDVGAAVRRGLAHLPYRPELLVVEPGRSLVAESAVLAASVIGVAQRGDETWAHLDVGGYNGLMEAVQTGGQWRFPLRTSRADEREVEWRPFTVTGPSCDSSDTMFYGVGLPATLAVDDRIYVGSAGAYTASYASRFNGFLLPRTLVPRSGPGGGFERPAR